MTIFLSLFSQRLKVATTPAADLLRAKKNVDAETCPPPKEYELFALNMDGKCSVSNNI